MMKSPAIKFYHIGNTTVATCKLKDGKHLRATAKYNPEDSNPYHADIGEALAEHRLLLKVRKHQLRNVENKIRGYDRIRDELLLEESRVTDKIIDLVQYSNKLDLEIESEELAIKTFETL